MIVVLDANVVYPPSLRDLLLTLAALDAFEPFWSDEVLEELTRNVLEDHPGLDSARFVEHTIGSMRRAFPEATVTKYGGLVERLDNDPKDRHVAAVALTVEADAIITLNVADFDSRLLRAAAIEILTPGELVLRLVDEVPDVVVAAVRALSDRWKNPARSPEEILELLSVHPSVAAPMARLRPLLGE